jgi:chaperone modulatory protein CbpM
MKNIAITVIDENNVLTFEEICRAIHADQDLVIQLIEYHVIHPKGSSQKNWQFDHISLKRARIARNFYYDCEVNLAGIGLLIDMLDKIEKLESEISRLK